MGAVTEVKLLKRSIDARKKSNVHGVVTAAVELAEGAAPQPAKGVTVRAYESPEPLSIPRVEPTGFRARRGCSARCIWRGPDCVRW